MTGSATPLPLRLKQSYRSPLQPAGSPHNPTSHVVVVALPVGPPRPPLREPAREAWEAWDDPAMSASWADENPNRKRAAIDREAVESRLQEELEYAKRRKVQEGLGMRDFASGSPFARPYLPGSPRRSVPHEGGRAATVFNNSVAGNFHNKNSTNFNNHASAYYSHDEGIFQRFISIELHTKLL